MSRIGNKVIEVPEKVEITQNGNVVTVKGPKGELSREISEDIQMIIDGEEITFTRPNDTNMMKSLHGTTRTNVWNMIVGVTEGYKKELELIGVGYRAQASGKSIDLNVGLSHPVHFDAPEGIEIETPENNKIIVSGINKEEVGQLAATIRDIRPPEPYKGKGIRYVGEYVIRKEGKTGK